MKMILCLALFMCGCNSPPVIEDGMIKTGGENYAIHEVKYDGCTYLVVIAGHKFSMTHKGNCPNH